MSNDASENVVTTTTVTTTEAMGILKRLVMNFPSDFDLLAAGWDRDAIDEACGAYEAALALIAQVPNA